MAETVNMLAVRPATAELEFTASDVLCFAMEHAGVPLVRDISVHNTGPTTLRNVAISGELVPNFGSVRSASLGPIQPGERVELDVLDLRLDPERLRSLTEPETVRLHIRVTSEGAPLSSGERDVTLLTPDHWPGQRTPMELLACFVTPNHPSVLQLLKTASTRLLEKTGDASLAGYAMEPRRIGALARSLFDELRSCSLNYVPIPPGSLHGGQRIRPADSVLRHMMGNCLDISTLLCGAFEAAGLNPLLVLTKGHALPAVWLHDERFPEGLVEDVERVRTQRDLGRLLAFDPTVALRNPNVPFQTALEEAARVLQATNSFESALDIRVSRQAKFTPLPVRWEGPEFSLEVLQGSESTVPELDADDFIAPTPPLPATALGTAAERRFKQWKDRLLDLTLRNRLLNHRPDGKRSVPLLVADLAAFEDLLAADARFEILPLPSQTSEARNEVLVQARTRPREAAERLRQDQRAGRLYTTLAADELIIRTRTVQRTARLDLEEGGASTVFVTIGVLRWYDKNEPTTARLAPLLFYPAQVELDRRTQRATVSRLQEDPIANFTLIEKLRADHQVDLSKLASIEPDDSGLDIPQMLRVAREAIQAMPRWEVLEEAHIGHFTFTKFLMWRDLHDNTDLLLKNPVVRHIAESGHSLHSPAAPVEPDQLDDTVLPSDLPCVVDADSTQQAAIVAALAGSSLVLQGPPGTGKSQTITNLVAAALYVGKTVLFVSEKMAALDVVFRRLRDVGLDDFCLELHSHKSNKKQVLASFEQSLFRSRSPAEQNWATCCAQLLARRTELNAYVRELHRQWPLGKSYYEAASRQRELGDGPSVPLELPAPAQVTRDQMTALLAALEDFASRSARIGPEQHHALYGVGPIEWSAAGQERLAGCLTDTRSRLLVLTKLVDNAKLDLRTVPGIVERARATAEAISRLVGAYPDRAVLAGQVLNPEWESTATRTLQYAKNSLGVERRRTDLAERWLSTLYEEEVAELRARFVKWATAFFLLAWIFLWGARGRMRRHARRDLPGNVEIRDDLASVIELKPLEAQTQQLAEELSDLLGESWVQLAPSPQLAKETAIATSQAQQAWKHAVEAGADAHVALEDREGWEPVRDGLREFADGVEAAHNEFVQSLKRTELELAPTAGAGYPSVDEQHDCANLEAVLERFANNLHALRPWCQYRATLKRAEELGLADVVAPVRQGSMSPAELVEAFERSFFKLWCSETLDALPRLRDFDAEHHEQLISMFRTADSAHAELSRRAVVGKLENNLPRPDAPARGSELDVVTREIRKKSRHLAVRKLLDALPTMRARLKPCFLMSPLSVAQYLPPDAQFDLVVFDEASQIETHDAIGAIARGNQIVIVGDSQQLPPTRFFLRQTADEDSVPDDNDVEELDSILDEALAKRIPERRLGWHYRSRHDSLIEFSNRHYYNRTLQVFPAARRSADNLGVKFTLVHGTYVSGGGGGKDGRTNPNEARAVVRYLVQQLRRFAPGARTFGVVTFSLSQRDAVQDLLDVERRDPDIEAHFSQEGEDVFVKNLENVQGDERDEIIFSVGYAKDAQGQLRHHFGPLSNQGGERRLNVAVTRARELLNVFSSITHDDIDVRRTRSLGAQHLREFLRHASERTSVELERASVREFDSALECDVHAALTGAGHEVHTKVGCGSYRVDLAVCHPDMAGTYVLAVECDGPTYGAAATARDRDRLRPSELRKLAWETHRVWSVEWRLNQAEEQARLLRAATEAIDRARNPQPVQGPLPSPQVDDDEIEEEFDFVEPGPAPASLPESLARVTDSGEPKRALGAAITAAQTYESLALPRSLGDPTAIYSCDPEEIRGRVRSLVAAEAPIGRDVVIRRVVQCWGLQRIGTRLRDLVDGQISFLARRGEVFLEDGFLWNSEVQKTSYSGFRGLDQAGNARNAEEIPAVEVANAAAWLLAENGSLSRDALLRETSRLLGFERLRSKVSECMQAGLRNLESQGRCVARGDTIMLQQPGATPTTAGASAQTDAPGASNEEGPLRSEPERAAKEGTLASDLARALRASPLFQARADATKREQFVAAIDFLETRGGAASQSAFAIAFAVETYRVPGRVSVLQEAGNIDQYQVLQFDPLTGTIRLDRQLLRQLFRLP